MRPTVHPRTQLVREAGRKLYAIIFLAGVGRNCRRDRWLAATTHVHVAGVKIRNVLVAAFLTLIVSFNGVVILVAGHLVSFMWVEMQGRPRPGRAES
jgi:hypothetical protein